MTPLVVRDEAEQDIASARAWYDKQRPGLGDDFLDAVQETFDALIRAPLHHPARRRDMRMAQTRRFPYVIYYRLLTGQLMSWR